MQISIVDFNNAAELIPNTYGNEWEEIRQVLTGMPLHLKASDQAGLQGNPIFDPVGTNSYIKQNLVNRGWLPNLPIPSEYDFMGTDVDFVKNRTLIEVQFSNYPFLLNNIVRSELFFQGNIQFNNSTIGAVIIITKGHMFPASNSTLYYEQAAKQLSALSQNKVFDIPIRLVGLLEEYKQNVSCVWTTYDNPRYSRTVVNQSNIHCTIQPGRSAASRATIICNQI